MKPERPAAGADHRDAILAAWETNARSTAFLVQELPDRIWRAAVPGVPTRNVSMIAAHVHNSRRSWIRNVGEEHGVAPPEKVDARKVRRRELLSSLKRSGRGIRALLELAFEHGGTIPPPSTYVWRNLPLDVGHILAYFAAHEGHHRGQIVLIARQVGCRLPVATTGGIWQWTRLSKDARP